MASITDTTANLQGTDVRESYYHKYGFSGSADAITGETRARQAPFADPVTLNFKWMINWNKPYGLFASKDNVNSARAYLERIGEKARLEMLEIFISQFQKFIRDYDFLILNCEGLAEIVNRKAHEFPKEDEDKVSFTIRETVDLRIQALLTMYREIWYDDIRGVEVLPANLRRFDCHVLVYSSGYYNMALYDIIKEGESYETIKNSGTGIEKLIFPTIKKLTQLNEEDLDNIPFNHVIVYIGDAMISNEDSGKPFFSELSNEMNGDYVKNNMTITYRFSNYSGIFHNVTGSFNYGSVLATLAAVNSASNQTDGGGKFSMKGFFNGLKDAGKQAAKDTWNKVKDDMVGAAKGIIAKNTPIGNALSLISDPNAIVGMVSNAVNAGIENLEQKYVYGNIAKLHNMVSGNFSDTMLTDMVLKATSNIGKQNSKFVDVPNDDKKVSTNMEQLPEPAQRDFSSGEKYVPDKIGTVEKGIKYGTGNIYKRESF